MEQVRFTVKVTERQATRNDQRRKNLVVFRDIGRRPERWAWPTFFCWAGSGALPACGIRAAARRAGGIHDMTPGAGDRLESDVRAIGEDVVAGFGLELVKLTLARAKRGWRIRLDIDRAGPVGVGLDDCQRVSHEIGARLEEQDRIPGSYVLEVSSPGADRPIRTPDDVRRNTGRRVEIETREPVDGRRSFRGVLAGQDGPALLLRLDEGDTVVHIPLDRITLARQELGFRRQDTPSPASPSKTSRML